MSGLFYAVILCVVGVAVALLVAGLIMTWDATMGPGRKRLNERWRVVSKDDGAQAAVRLSQKRHLSENATVQAWLQQSSFIRALDRVLVQAGLQISLTQAFGLFLVFTVSGAAVAFFGGAPVWAALLLMPVLWVLLAWYVLYRKRRRLLQIDLQLPAALEMMARALQVGHALSGALLIAAKESRDPIASELQTVFDEMNFGISLQVALPHLAERIASDSVRYFVVAAMVQSETGGNLADILRSTASLIRERHKLTATVKVLSAEGRLSAVILSVLPFAIAALLSWVNPEFIGKLWTDPLGLKLLTGSLVLAVVGVIWMQRLVSVRV
jgi:tight adherence protein B